MADRVPGKWFVYLDDDEDRGGDWNLVADSPDAVRWARANTGREDIILSSPEPEMMPCGLCLTRDGHAARITDLSDGFIRIHVLEGPDAGMNDDLGSDEVRPLAELERTDGGNLTIRPADAVTAEGGVVQRAADVLDAALDKATDNDSVFAAGVALWEGAQDALSILRPNKGNE